MKLFKPILLLGTTILLGIALIELKPTLQAEELLSIEYLDNYSYEHLIMSTPIDPPLEPDPEYQCFANIVWHEARGDGIESQQAVAQVVYNRSVSGVFPKDICHIMKQKAWWGCEFSWMCNSRLKRAAPTETELEDMSHYIASIYNGSYTVKGLEQALYFHACEKPKKKLWTGTSYLAKISSHCYYRQV